MSGIEKIVNNCTQLASQAIQKTGSIIQSGTKPIEAGSEKLARTLDGIATTNTALIKKKSALDIKDFSLLNGDKTKIFIHSKDKAGNTNKIPFLFDIDNSGAIPIQGHKSGLGVRCPEISDYPIQEAWYKLSYFLRDLQYNGGKFSDEVKSLLDGLGIKEEEMMARIAENLKKQNKLVSNLKPSEGECILYRFISSIPENFKNFLDGLNPGDTKIMDYAPIHTTGDVKFVEQMSECFPNEVTNMIRIKTPKGSKLISGKPVEDGGTEVIFPSKSVFKFLGKQISDGLNLWDFEYILPN